MLYDILYHVMMMYQYTVNVFFVDTLFYVYMYNMAIICVKATKLTSICATAETPNATALYTRLPSTQRDDS